MEKKRDTPMRIKWGDIAVFAVILVAAATIFISFSKKNSAYDLVAVIRIEGKEYRRIKLSDIPDGQTIIISLKEKKADMDIALKRNGVCVLRSGCPDKVCVHTGWLEKPGQSAVCLPYRVVIRLEGADLDNHIDGIAG